MEKVYERICELVKAYIGIYRADMKKMNCLIGHIRCSFQPITLILGLLAILFVAHELCSVFVLVYCITEITLYFMRDYLEHKDSVIDFLIFMLSVYLFAYLLLFDKFGVVFIGLLLCMVFGVKYIINFMNQNK